MPRRAGRIGVARHAQLAVAARPARPGRPQRDAFRHHGAGVLEQRAARPRRAARARVQPAWTAAAAGPVRHGRDGQPARARLGERAATRAGWSAGRRTSARARTRCGRRASPGPGTRATAGTPGPAPRHHLRVGVVAWACTTIAASACTASRAASSARSTTASGSSAASAGRPSARQPASRRRSWSRSRSARLSDRSARRARISSSLSESSASMTRGCSVWAGLGDQEDALGEPEIHTRWSAGTSVADRGTGRSAGCSSPPWRRAARRASGGRCAGVTIACTGWPTMPGPRASSAAFARRTTPSPDNSAARRLSLVQTMRSRSPCAV